ncbi:ATP-binding cassette domain-containing protein [Schlegelella sp. S2-27]|uniref:ATP-binding cassette domain-containing protein n=1 Tax=Caldimonas mangrovi TaxID=2944811 RepID=A0ABT0YP58_9BURK|nr:oligopeptide/dipeptide ABC transporter ATP-binding protein [Caldimonas mangrovi]MCM5680174.1 ATP-binding cassette domain-containing protein [Caldimonas mangrovi]
MQPIVEIENLRKSFSPPPGLLTRLARRVGMDMPLPKAVHAVNDVSLQVQRGEVLGLVGESGCGKSTLGRMVAGILEPSAGILRIDGAATQRHGARSVHRRVQMVFQNPYASLNPRMRIDQILTEAAVHHGLVEKRVVRDHAAALLRQVGLDPSYADRYPHQFSGGQRQRIAIARALSLHPEVVVCDEAVSALDVSVQAQILNLFLDLRESNQLTYLFISHNLAVVEYLADRVAIMYLGRIVELADTESLFRAPNHPYTQALISDAPRLDKGHSTHRPIQGELPSPYKPPSGCAFHPRCPHAMPRCRSERPALVELAPGHLSACHLNDARESIVRFIPPKFQHDPTAAN